MRIIKYNPPSGAGCPKVTFRKKAQRLLRLVISYLYLPIGYMAVLITRRPKKSYRYRVAICATFKDEARYLEEWLTYHSLIGVEHFYLYNNNSTDNHKEVLAPFIESGDVILIEWPGQYQQLAIYQDCYDKRKSETQWLGFIDIDEFVCMKNYSNIIQYLIKFRKYPSLVLCWRIFGTSGIEKTGEEFPVIENFTSCWESMVNIGKSFINTTYDFRPIVSPHFFWAKSIGNLVPIAPVNEKKIFVTFWNYPFSKFYDKLNTQINHYWSKSWESFMYKETRRGSALSNANNEIRNRKLEERFNYHEKRNLTKDYTIQRHLLELKLKMERYRNSISQIEKG